MWRLAQYTPDTEAGLIKILSLDQIEEQRDA